CTFRVYFRVFAGPPEFHPGEELHGHGGGDHGHEHDHAHGNGDDHARDPEAHSAEHFHPHAPGWAINLVLIVLAIGTFGAIGLNFVGPHAFHGGWAAEMVEGSTAAWPRGGE